MMTTNKKLTIGIITLLIINLIILGVLMTGHKRNNNARNDNRQGPGQMIIKKLDFNEEQVASFKILMQDHRKHVKSKDEEIRVVKNAIFNSLGSDDSVNIDSLGTKIGNLQKDIEVAHYKHFMKIKKLCEGDQVAKFNELSKELSKMFSRKGRASKKRK